MIEFLEVRDTSLKLIGIIDTAKSIIWEAEYYGAGAFEVYTPLTDQTRELLQIGYYITRRNEKNAAIIEAVNYTDSPTDGVMIIAKGRMAKSLLDRRLVYRMNYGNHVDPVIISGNVAAAVQSVVRDHAGQGAGEDRTMGILQGSNGGITKTITTGTGGEESTRQSSYKNLLSFTDAILEEYECGALIRISDQLQLVYDCFEGQDRSVDNTAGNTPVTFSQDFENLLTVEYEVDTTAFKNFALIGGEGEGLARIFIEYGTEHKGFDRREVFVDASSYPRKYQDESGQEHTYDFVTYLNMIAGEAATKLKELITTETFTGEINLTHSPYKYGRDFWLGDLVTIQDNKLGLYQNVRILKATEAQDDNGYLLSIEYGN